MNVLKYKVLIPLFLVVLSVSAQEKNIKKGDNAYNAYNYIYAQKEYLEGIASLKENATLYKNLGEAYYKVADYDNAAKWLKDWYYFSDIKENETVLKFSQALKSVGNYELSDSILNTQKNYIKDIETNSGRFKVNTVAFNSELSDFAPTFYGDNLVFASNRKRRSASKNIHKWNNQPFLDLYTVSLDLLEDAERIDNGLNTKYHESTAIYTKDEKTVYFTRNNFTNKKYKSDTSGINRLKLYKGVKNEKGYWDVQELPFNSDEYSVAHPALSIDEKILYFSSDMPGGMGASDLYKVTIGTDTFSTPENLGTVINTNGRDTFPFVSPDNQLYFASDGHLGLGGLDVFVSEIKHTGFGEVYNIGRPINSQQDDFTFIINTEGKGFFASNRNGAGYDDIFSFVQTQPLQRICEQTLTGRVQDRNTNSAIAEAQAMLLNENGDVISEITTDENGIFDLFISDCQSRYSIKILKEDFILFEKPVKTSKVNGATIELNVLLDAQEKVPSFENGLNLNEALSIQPIYFDRNKSNIKQESQVELDKIIDFLQKHPEIKIEVQSYADSRGQANYNLKLSKLRSESAANYIINQGNISKERITTSGFGETKLLNECTNGKVCSEYDHQLNRRSEFIVVE